MNVLEKILEEVEKESKLAHEEMRRCASENHLQFDEIKGYARACETILEIIRSYINKKKRVSSAEIIKRFIDEKPYYEIKYKEIGKDEYDFGYGSYTLDYVLEWLNECFEFCEDAKVEVYTDNWIPIEEQLPEERKECMVTVMYTGFMGMYGIWIKTGHMENGEWWGECMGGKVIAWQLLPEAYKKVNNIHVE